jgi:hypothetical protein
MLRATPPRANDAAAVQGARDVMFELTKWDSFYGIVGSAAGALIGLQFVVMALIAARPPARAAQTSAAFATPTIVHFSIALLISALLCAPWETIRVATALCGLFGAAAAVYVLITAWRMRAQTAYSPDFEDWLFHVVLPLVAYGILVASPFTVFLQARQTLFAIGSAVLLLVFIGIHNAWDAVAYFVLVNQPNRDKGS